jgi:hypothetical protein
MNDTIKWMYMSNWLCNNEKARTEEFTKEVANALAGPVVAVTQHKK